MTRKCANPRAAAKARIAPLSAIEHHFRGQPEPGTLGRSIMRVLLMSFLLLASTAAGQNAGVQRDSIWRPINTNQPVPEIESIAVFGPPMISGGYSFYADRKGRLVHQSIRPDDEKKYGFIEDRLVLREHPELFTGLVEQLRAVDFLTYREGREHGIPDELRLRFELTLSNGSKIIASKWDSDPVKALDELLERMRAIIHTMDKIQKPVRIPYDSKDFGAHSRILPAA